VQARLDLWIKAHIDKLLGPLSSLAAAEDVTGIGRGVAYRLIEDLGVLERQKVAEDVKGLDQNSRAALRKYGVRFGAYHVYVPPLLKPAPRALATLLYAIKNDNGEMRGLDEVQQLAASGRTSIPANKDVSRNLYRIAGYRVAGERAVRVDILERLADLIRPALAWRDNAPGIKPQGALDGTGFTVTVGMTSLVGSSGEDFASILRSLGYRMERRPKPAEPEVPAAAPGADPELQHRDVAYANAPDDGGPESGVAGAAEAEASEPTAVIEAAAESSQTAPESQTAEQPAEIAEPPVAMDAAALDGEITPADAASADASNEAADSAAVATAEPVLIEVWRPGRFEGRDKRPHRKPQRRDQRGAQQPTADQPAVAAEGAPAAGVTTPDQRRQDHRPHGPRPPRKDRGGRPRRHEAGQEGQQRFGRPDQKPRQEGRPRQERREREPDPNSPFAKLAALKAQLEADSKERR
jgi:ATP-dependent RNA helicase SUPV3L1/SUV3